MLASPWMLAWAIAALAPLLIHYLLRRRRRTVSWSAMEWLRLAARQSARPLRFWQWLVLALRALALALVGIAVAQPLGCKPMTLPPMEQGVLRVLVVDASMSMQTVNGKGESRWQRALQSVQTTLDTAKPNDSFLLVLMRRQPEALIATPTTDPAAVRSALSEVQPNQDWADWNATQTLIHTLLPAAIERATNLEHVEVNVWSDQQRATWDRVAMEPVPLSLPVQYRIQSVAEDSTDNRAPFNAYWTDPRVESELPVTTEPVTFAATLRHTAQMPTAPLEVRFLIDDQTKQSTRITLEPNQPLTVRFTESVSAGTHRVSFEVEGDALAADNRITVIARVHPRLRVGVIGDRPAATELLSLALAPDPRDPRLEIVTGNTTLLLDPAARFDALMLCDLSTYSRRVAEALQQQCERGCGLVYWLGAETSAAEFNRALVDADLPPLTPARLLQPSARDQYVVNAGDFTHPLLAPFAAYPQSGLLSMPLFQYWKCEPIETVATQVALTTESGDPLLVTGVREDVGRMALVAIPPSFGTATDTTWSGLPAWPSFPPLARRCLEWVLAAPVEPLMKVGDSISGISSDSSLATVLLTRPDGSRRIVALRQAEGVGEWSFIASDQAGVYQVREGTDTHEIAVRVPPEESDLGRVELAGLVSTFEAASVAPPLSQSAPSSPKRNHVEYPQWFRAFVTIALALLLLEMLVLRQMRRRFA